MRSFVTGLVVALLSTTIATTAYAADAWLWEEEPTQAQLWSNVNTLLDKDSAVFGGVPKAEFEPLLIDKTHQVFVMLGQEALGTALVVYIEKPQDVVVDANLDSESKCEDEQGNLTVDCDDMDFVELGASFASI